MKITVNLRLYSRSINRRKIHNNGDNLNVARIHFIYTIINDYKYEGRGNQNNPALVAAPIVQRVKGLYYSTVRK